MTRVSKPAAGQSAANGKGLRGRVPRPGRAPGVATSSDVGAGGVVVQPRLQRRPVVVLVSLALVVLGAVLSVWAYSSLGNAQEVVAVRTDVERGAVISAEALQVVRVGVDPALRVVPADELAGLVGQRASTDLKAGQLVVPESVTTEVLPRVGFSVVGLSLGDGQVPVGVLVVGDRVRVVSTPGQQGEVADAELRVFEGTVVSVAAADVSGKVALVVEVPQAHAAELAARSATGKLAVVLDAREK